MINGNIAGYQEQMDAIDDLIAKRKYEIVQKAALPAYEEAYTNALDHRMQAEADLASLEEAKAAREEAYAKAVAIFGTSVVDSWLERGSAHSAMAASEIKDLLALDDALKDHETAYAESAAAIKNDMQDITSFERAELYAQAGLYDEAIAELSYYTSETRKKLQEMQGGSRGTTRVY